MTISKAPRRHLPAASTADISRRSFTATINNYLLRHHARMRVRVNVAHYDDSRTSGAAPEWAFTHGNARRMGTAPCADIGRYRLITRLRRGGISSTQ